VNWSRISTHQKLSKKFRTEHNLSVPSGNWLYVTREEKLAAIKKCGLYEINDEIIAYKGVRSDGYSKFNFQYHYEVGGTYESHCDCNLNYESSFGLSAWTLEKAREYCNEKIFKVAISIDDLGAIVHDGEKLRCWKFRILE
jgi:hypothetical protein